MKFLKNIGGAMLSVAPPLHACIIHAYKYINVCLCACACINVLMYVTINMIDIISARYIINKFLKYLIV